MVTPKIKAVLYLLLLVVVLVAMVLLPPPVQSHLGRMLLACVVPGVDREADLLPELQGPCSRDHAVPAHLEAPVVPEVHGVPRLAALHEAHWGHSSG